MAQQKAKNKHSEALDLIGYGLAKFAGPTLRKNAIASHISGSRNAFFRRLVEVGIATTSNVVSCRQDNFDPFFGTKRGYTSKVTQYSPIKERIDAVVGSMDMSQYAEFIEAIIAKETSGVVDSKYSKLIEDAYNAVTRLPVQKPQGEKQHNNSETIGKDNDRLSNGSSTSLANKEKWNLIVDHYKLLYTRPEAKIQAEWETYCTELFEYRKILYEIESQRRLTVGSGSSIIPDIILRTNGKDIFDIELKQYNLPFNKTFEEQLISYLNQTHLSVGMIVCNRIYLYYYEYATITINKLEIPFEKDNTDGIALMEMLTKNTFSTSKIQEYIQEKVQREERITEIKQRLTNDWIKETIKVRLLELYDQAEIEEVLDCLSFKYSSTKEVHFQTTTSFKADSEYNDKGLNPDTSIPSILRQWCKQKTDNGELYLLPYKDGIKYTRFTTADLDVLFPCQENNVGGWRNGYFYSYEIVFEKDRFRIQLVFNNNNAPESFVGLFNQTMLVTNSKPRKDPWQWWTVFSSKPFKCEKSTTPTEVFHELDLQFLGIREKVVELISSKFNSIWLAPLWQFEVFSPLGILRYSPGLRCILGKAHICRIHTHLLSVGANCFFLL